MSLQLEKRKAAPFPHRVNEAADIRRELKGSDWHDTNAAGNSLVLRKDGVQYEVAVGVAGALVDLGIVTPGLSYSFHPDGVQIALGVGARVLIVDLRDGSIAAEHTVDAEVTSLAFTRDGVLVCADGVLIDLAVSGGAWTQRWSHSCDLLEVWGTGTLGLVGLSWGRRAMAWAVARADGLVGLGHHAQPGVKTCWYHDGRTAICDDYSPNNATCFEITGGQQTVDGAADADVSFDGAIGLADLEALPKMTAGGAANKQPTEPSKRDLPMFTSAVFTLLEREPVLEGGGIDATAILELPLPDDLRAYVELVAPRLSDATDDLDVFDDWDLSFRLEPWVREGETVAIGVGVSAGGDAMAVKLGHIESTGMAEVYASLEKLIESEAQRRDKPDPNLIGLLPDDLPW